MFSKAFVTGPLVLAKESVLLHGLKIVCFHKMFKIGIRVISFECFVSMLTLDCYNATMLNFLLPFFCVSTFLKRAHMFSMYTKGPCLSVTYCSQICLNPHWWALLLCQNNPSMSPVWHGWSGVLWWAFRLLASQLHLPLKTCDVAMSFIDKTAHITVLFFWGGIGWATMRTTCRIIMLSNQPHNLAKPHLQYWVDGLSRHRRSAHKHLFD